MTDAQQSTDASSTDVTDATDVPVAHFKIWLDEVGIEIGREPLDPKCVPFTNDDGDLVIPHQSLKFKKGPKVAEKHYRIFLTATDENEIENAWAGVRTKDIPTDRVLKAEGERLKRGRSIMRQWGEKETIIVPRTT